MSLKAFAKLYEFIDGDHHIDDDRVASTSDNHFSSGEASESTKV